MPRLAEPDRERMRSLDLSDERRFDLSSLSRSELLLARSRERPRSFDSRFIVGFSTELLLRDLDLDLRLPRRSSSLLLLEDDELLLDDDDELDLDSELETDDELLELKWEYGEVRSRRYR